MEQRVSPDKKKSSLDRRLDDFEEEIEDLSDRFDRSIDRASERFEEKYYSTFGVLGPFLFSLLNLVFLIIAIWVLDYMGQDLNSKVLLDTSEFLLEYIAMFFGFMLLFNYSSYLNKRFNDYFKWIYPAISAVSITLVLWILANLYDIINNELNIVVLDDAVSSIEDNLLIIFLLILLLRYLVFISKESKRESWRSEPKTVYHKKYSSDIKKDLVREVGSKRLYRSGRDKLLGGVCGGIADYVNIDPVVIRILWVIGAFASLGTAILIYIILWIIMPRNPEHRWID